METARRLAAVQRHLCSAVTGESAASPDYDLATDIPDPRHDSNRTGADAGNGRPGNMPRGEHLQGFGIMGSHPPPFDPIKQADEAFAFYQENGYVVVNSLSQQEVAGLNTVCDEFVTTRGPEIDVPGQGQLFFPLLNYPEFDFTVIHPNTYPMVQRILGGADKPRLIEFNCEWVCRRPRYSSSERRTDSFAINVVQIEDGSPRSHVPTAL
jgi:hypothetical protein